MLTHQDMVQLFRNSAPYINKHRGKTFVLMLSGEAVANPNFATIIEDIALLNSLGVRLIIVHGARPQIEERLALRGIASSYHEDYRITDSASLSCVQDAVGSVRCQIEALLTMGLANSPMHGAQIRVASGNLVVAKPIGVIDGVDLQQTGAVRRVDEQGINDHLNDGSIVLLSPIGYSSTGEIFNLSHEEVATAAARSMDADKLIAFSAEKGLVTHGGELIRNLDFLGYETMLSEDQFINESAVLSAIYHSVAEGVERAHCVSYATDGAMLKELFTRDGTGSLVTEMHYEQLRDAHIDDAVGIFNLIKPLEEAGALATRSRERLETEIQHFKVIERDGLIIACAALFPYVDEHTAELASVATHPDYRGRQCGKRLLEAFKLQALEQQYNSIFVLTTLTAHWFLEQGFAEAPIEWLPQEKRDNYNYDRNSKVFRLSL